MSEKTPGPGARTPAARLVDDPRSFALGIPGTGGFSAGELAARAGTRTKRVLADLRRPPEAIRAAVPEPLRARLGLDGAAAPVAAGDPGVDLLLALRHGQLGQCYEASRTEAAARTEAYAILYLDGDGRPADVRVASAPADSPLEECVRGVVEGWEFPASDDGYSGPFLVRFAFDAAPGPAAGYASPGSLRPALRDVGCVERRLQVPPAYRGSTGAVTVKLAIDAAGKPGLVHPLGACSGRDRGGRRDRGAGVPVVGGRRWRRAADRALDDRSRSSWTAGSCTARSASPHRREGDRSRTTRVRG